VNSASVSAATSDPNPSNNNASTNVSVTPTADLAVVLVAPSGSVLPGTRFTYSVSVTNNGPNDATNVQLASTLPSGIGFVGNAGDCSGAWPCSFASLPSGQTRMVTTTACVPSAYQGANPFALNASVSAATTDPSTANNSAAANVSVYTDVLFRDGFDAGTCP
jgi:uncharacterized repeat protein (TIGR01451 family)